MEKKSYIIVGDNNFWYHTTGQVSEDELYEEIEYVKEGIAEGRYAHVAEPKYLYAYEAYKSEVIKL